MYKSDANWELGTVICSSVPSFHKEVLTNSNPDSQLHAKDLVVVFALHLAETISSFLVFWCCCLLPVLQVSWDWHVLDHSCKVLYDPETKSLFLPLFWFYPIYREMLFSASRHRPSKSMELLRKRCFQMSSLVSPVGVST